MKVPRVPHSADRAWPPPRHAARGGASACLRPEPCRPPGPPGAVLGEKPKLCARKGSFNSKPSPPEGSCAQEAVTYKITLVMKTCSHSHLLTLTHPHSEHSLVTGRGHSWAESRGSSLTGLSQAQGMCPQSIGHQQVDGPVARKWGSRVRGAAVRDRPGDGAAGQALERPHLRGPSPEQVTPCWLFGAESSGESGFGCGFQGVCRPGGGVGDPRGEWLLRGHPLCPRAPSPQPATRGHLWVQTPSPGTEVGVSLPDHTVWAERWDLQLYTVGSGLLDRSPRTAAGSPTGRGVPEGWTRCLSPALGGGFAGGPEGRAPHHWEDRSPPGSLLRR